MTSFSIFSSVALCFASMYEFLSFCIEVKGKQNSEASKDIIDVLLDLKLLAELLPALLVECK